MRKLRKYNVDIVCLSKVRITDSGHSLVNVPGEEACYHLYHSGVVDNTGRHGVSIAFPTPTTPPSYKVLQRRTHQEPNQPHASAVPLGIWSFSDQGVLSEAAKAALLAWVPISSRLASA